VSIKAEIVGVYCRSRWPCPNAEWTIGSTMQGGAEIAAESTCECSHSRCSWPLIVGSDSACHAGGRGFESRRSRSSSARRTLARRARKEPY
jgi:hypothetical protein